MRIAFLFEYMLDLQKQHKHFSKPAKPVDYRNTNRRKRWNTYILLKE